MHSSRMSTIRCNGRRGWGVCPGEIYPGEAVYPSIHTLVKTLPFCNYVADSKNNKVLLKRFYAFYVIFDVHSKSVIKLPFYLSKMTVIKNSADNRDDSDDRIVIVIFRLSYTS